MDIVEFVQVMCTHLQLHADGTMSWVRTSGTLRDDDLELLGYVFTSLLFFGRQPKEVKWVLVKRLRYGTQLDDTRGARMARIMSLEQHINDSKAKHALCIRDKDFLSSFRIPLRLCIYGCKPT